jgi:hypothetical protein
MLNCNFFNAIYINRLLVEELGMPSEQVLRGEQKLYELGAEEADFMSIFHKIGLRPLQKYVDFAADKLTDYGRTVVDRAGESLSRGVRESKSLREMLNNLTGSDLLMIYCLVN